MCSNFSSQFVWYKSYYNFIAFLECSFFSLPLLLCNLYLFSFQGSTLGLYHLGMTCRAAEIKVGTTNNLDFQSEVLLLCWNSVEVKKEDQDCRPQGLNVWGPHLCASSISFVERVKAFSLFSLLYAHAPGGCIGFRQEWSIKVNRYCTARCNLRVCRPASSDLAGLLDITFCPSCNFAD